MKAAYSVTEEDIYYRCPEYLDNKAYDNYMVRCEERIEKGMATISDAEGLGASILYSLQNGADIIISELASKAGIGQSTKDKLNKEVVYQLIQVYLSSDTSATNTASQIGNAYSTISDAYNVANATDLYNYKVSLKNSSLNLSDNQVDKLVDMYTDADTFSKILGYAGNAQKALKIITAYIEMQDLDLAVLNKLDDAFSSMDSEFASAIRSIMSDRTSDFLTFAKKNYLQDEVIKKMVSAVAKYGSSPVLFVKNVCANILGKIYKSFCPTADQIIQAGMCQAYTYLARNKVYQLRKEFKNGKASEDKIEQYKVVYGFYITTMKTTMNKVAGCVNGSDKSIKQALKSWAGSLSGFTYATYMNRCRSDASADVSAGLLKISGNTVTRKTPNGTAIDGNYDSTESIKARLATIKQKYPPNQGVTWKGDWGGARQCFGFARMVFYFLYGKNMPANYYPNACYQYQQNNGVNKVGQLTGNFTAAQVQQLFAQAKIGDVIQASTTASSGQHTMIFTGLTSKGITVYDCNAAVNGCAPGGCGINEWERSYSELAKGTYGYGSSNGGITIYRADNYASIYGDGDDVFYDDSANFIIENGVLIKYTGWQPFVEIPDTVTAIGDEAFLNNKTMIHVLIPDSVTSIGESAFEGCTSLLSVSIPDSVEFIGNSAFKDCTSLGYAYLPNNVKYTVIGYRVFCYCENLKEIEIPEYVTRIESESFYDCVELQEIKFNPYVTVIGDSAFYNCNIEELSLPKKCDNLGSKAFGQCEQLKSVFINKKLTNTSGGLWDYEGPFCGCSSLNDVVFESGITGIPVSIFAGCTGIRDIEIPDTITVISDYAFQDCVNLKKIEFPSALKRIGQRAFEDCDSIERVDFNKVEHVGGYAFSNCDSLSYVFIPKSIESTGYSFWDMKDGGVFAGCNQLKEIEFDQKVTAIPDNFFRSAQITKIEFPSALKKIGQSAFENASLLKDIVWNDGIEEIESNAFKGCMSIETMNIPDSVNSMGTYIFSGDNKIKNVYLPKGRINITEGVFYNCNSLESITFPDTVEAIREYAFGNCSALKEVKLSPKLNYIYSYAFSGCASLEKLHLPDSTKQVQRNAFENCEVLTDIILGAGIKNIEAQTFQGCSSLESIILPYQMETIGDDAFKNCTKLRKITIPKATTSISDSAFSYPDKMTIYGVAGSYAEQYATENDIAFVAQEIATEEVTLTETELTLGRNTEYQLTAGLSPMDSTDEVTWSSSDEKVAEVDQTGKIQAIAAGTAVITAKAGEKTATCKVTVNIPMTSIYLNKTSIELNSIGDSYQLSASYSPSDAEGTIIWKSEDEGIVSVDQTGKVTAVGKGTTTITASCGNVIGTCTVVSKGVSNGSEIVPAPSPQPSLEPKPDNQPANTPKPSLTPQLPTGGTVAQPSQTPSPTDQTSKDGENGANNTIVLVKINKIKGLVVKNQKKFKVKVIWKKLTKVSGYQIQYAPNKKFKKAKSKMVKSTSAMIKKLKKKKTYFVRVRAYKLVDGKKVYGKWSAVKKVKIKK